MSWSSFRQEIEAVNSRLALPASRAELVSFDPSDPLSSFFGAVLASTPHEAWPEYLGSPMRALCQISCASLPYVPPRLTDISMLRIWVASRTEDLLKSDSVCVRATPVGERLVPIQSPHTTSVIKAMSIRWHAINDPPSYFDLPRSIPDEIAEAVAQLQHPTCESTKVGGYAYSMQGGGVYRPAGGTERDFDFVAQIGSERAAGWEWGDSGVCHVARGRSNPENWDTYWECC
jgi:hypothetical protein